MNIGLIVGNTRNGRKADLILDWVLPELEKSKEIQWNIIDLKNYKLPFLGQDLNGTDWIEVAQKIQSCEAFIFLAGEINHSIAASLKNAIDLFGELWYYKPAGIIGYGVSGNGARASEHLKAILASLSVRVIEPAVLISLFEDMKERKIQPRPMQKMLLSTLIKELKIWTPYCDDYRKNLEEGKKEFFDYNENWEGYIVPGGRSYCQMKED